MDFRSDVRIEGYLILLVFFYFLYCPVIIHPVSEFVLSGTGTELTIIMQPNQRTTACPLRGVGWGDL